MAYAEMTLTLARMVFLLDMRFEEGLENTGVAWEEDGSVRFETKDFFVSTHVGPVVQFRRRLKRQL